MAKAPKRQRHSEPHRPSKKLRKNVPNAFPIGPTAAPEAEKDDEERRLESMLFGVPYVPSHGGAEAKGKMMEIVDLTSGMEHLQDEDLFYFDDTTDGVGNLPEVDVEAAIRDASLELDAGLPSADQHEEDEEEDEEEDDFTGFGSTGEAAASLPSSSRSSTPSSEMVDEPLEVPFDSLDAIDLPIASSSKRKAAAWVDEDDAALRVSLADNTRLRKLREAAAEDEVTGKVYETRLRRQYEKVNPAPEWATKARSKGREAEPEDEVEALLHSTGDLVQPAERGGRLPSGELQVERLRDANQAGKSAGEVKAVMFHPTLPVLLTAGVDRRLRLFNVDGHSNPLLQTVHVPNLPLTNALFHPSGTSVLLTGPRPFYYSYDLQSGSIAQSPRGLWGSAGSNPNAADRSFEISQFSPDGRMLAVGGRRGNVWFVDWRTGGVGGQVVGGVKMNSGVRAVQWGAEGRDLVSVGEDAEVYIWDVGSLRCVRRWKDDSGFGPTAMEISRDSRYLAFGSSTGIVNLYDSSAMAHGPTVSGNPKALKAVMNLTTSISTLRFNADSQILCLASRSRKDELRMMHLPSNTVFYNWPTSGTPLGHVTSVDFSSRSEYVAIGNNRGKVLLYQLRHYIT